MKLALAILFTALSSTVLSSMALADGKTVQITGPAAEEIMQLLEVNNQSVQNIRCERATLRDGREVVSCSLNVD